MKRVPLVFVLLSLASITSYTQQIEVVELSDPLAILGTESQGSLMRMPGDLAAGNGDTLYVLDSQGLVVVVYSEFGNELFRFGRGGAGPGEFSRPRAIAFSGHSVLIGDYGLSRIEEFSSTGQYLRTIKLMNQPRSGMVVFQGDLYVGVQSQECLIVKVPLANPEENSPFLTFQHPQFAEMDRLDRFRKGSVELAAGETGLIVAFPGLGSFMVVPADTDPNQCKLIDPQGEIIEREWDRFDELFKRMEGRVGLQMFNRIDEWTPGQILLEVRTGFAETFHAIGIIVDAISGEDLGIRFKPEDQQHGRLCLLNDNKLAWINWGNSTVSVFQISNR